MKKLLFVFTTLFALALLTGCGTDKNTVRFDGDEKADILSADEEAAAEEEVATEEGDEEEAATEEEDEDAKTEENNEDEEEAASAETPSPAKPGKLTVTSFEGAYLKTAYSYNVVKGGTPAGTHTIKINDYKLSKYIGGQTQWDYIASTRFGTLKDGLNTYTVKAYDKDGEVLDSLIFSINYEAPATPQILPGVGSGHWTLLLAGLMASALAALMRKLRWL